jgi:xanthine dehydrogenase molybdopterin-binding subunit B
MQNHAALRKQLVVARVIHKGDSCYESVHNFHLFLKSCCRATYVHQVTGEATYVDDINHTPDVLVAALVLSTRPHARLLKVDPSAALSVEGVAGYFGAADIPGSNMIGPKLLDEEVFATNEVTCVGQV